MTGTIINVITVLIGGAAGLAFGSRLPERVRQTVLAGLGLFTLVIGVQMFLGTGNPVVVLLALVIGGLVGEGLRIEDWLAGLGARLETRLAGGEGDPGSRFVRGLLTAFLLFCIGPLTILGAIQDGLTGDFNLLLVKSVLDLFAALALASTLGVGVLFSVVPLLIYQGALSLLAGAADAVLTDAMVAEMTAVGGVLLVGLALSSLLEIKKIRVGNFLPALLIAPLLTPVVIALLAVLAR